ncbi:MAG TPA: diguanylate cyclase [Gallionella sp.]
MTMTSKSEEFADEWTTLLEDTPLSVRQIVNEQINEHSAKLAELFYSIMMADPEASVFLSHDMVNQRLHASMQRWLRELYSMEPRDPHEIYKHQCHVGEVHARIQLPFTLIMRGARLLRYAISGYLVESRLDRGDLVKATNYVSEMMELALDAMTDYYVVNVEQSARTDESYRMFALGQNMVAEREKQRAALMEWTQKILLGLLAGAKESEIPSLGKSSFGLWLQHKAAIVFESAPELEQMRTRIAEVEKNIHLKVAESRQNPGNAKVLMQEIESGIAAIKSSLGGLFDRYIELDSTRDSLALLLNRRYLPSVLKREMTMARRGNARFALLLIDIDHFKDINATHNHTVGDQVLQLSSELIVGNVRAGDFVFHYGGDEIMVVLVEIDKEIALQVAENIRAKFDEMPLQVEGGKSVPVTVSIGVAAYNGHPDYETIVKDAEGALHEAKEAGRNRCVLSGR